MQDTANRKGAEDKFRSLLEAAPDAVVVVDESGSLSIINPQTEKLFGYNRSDVVNKQGIVDQVEEGRRCKRSRTPCEQVDQVI